LSLDEDEFQNVFIMTKFALGFARKIAGSTDDDLTHKVLDELDRVATHHWMSVPRESIDVRKSGLHWANYANYAGYWNGGGSEFSKQDNFLSLTVSYGLTEYVRAKSKQYSSLVRSKKDCPMLLYLVPVGGKFAYSFPSRTELLSLLIEYGAGPNASFGGNSLWQEAIEGVNMEYAEDDNAQQRRKAICKVIIEAGAHPNVLWHPVEKSRTATSRFFVELYTPLSYEASDPELYEMLRSRGATAFVEEIGLRAETNQEAKEES
jgi:hypothetical protein